jgi:DNA-binding GntR family transcriptional regulator
MQAVKQKIYSMVENMPHTQLTETAKFIRFIKMRDEEKSLAELEALNVTSTAFWDNEIDDEVWNNA